MSSPDGRRSLDAADSAASPVHTMSPQPAHDAVGLTGAIVPRVEVIEAASLAHLPSLDDDGRRSKRSSLSYGEEKTDEGKAKTREEGADYELLGNERQLEAPGLTDWLFRRRGLVGELDAIATQPSVFDDPEKAHIYQPHPKWENLHRFDPKARWTWREEQGVIRKNDLYITAWAVVMFFALELDRGNISQANSDNLLQDLGITRADYNLGNTVFRLSFLAAELPSQMISKRIGSDVWVPAQVTMWSIASAAQFWMSGRTSFLLLRVLIGLLQGGFIADQCLYLSYFYKKTELPVRLAFFWMSNAIVDIVAPFMAFGLLRMRGVLGYEGWRWLFLIEGCITLSIGLWSFVMMPSSPTASKTWFWRRGWYTAREEVVQVNRIIRDDPSKASMHNRQGLTLRQIYKSAADWQLWPLYLLGFTFGMPDYPVSSYLTIQLRGAGFDTFETNLLSMPTAVLAALTLLTVTLLSERFNRRAWLAMSQNIWYLPGFVALYVLPASAGRWSLWGVLTYVLAAPLVHAINVGWVSRQSGSVQTRTVATALYNMFRQLSAIAGVNVYAPSDAPLYRRGNLAMMILAICNVCLYALAYFFYRLLNLRRERKWKSMSKEERIHYLDTTEDTGLKRLDFRFAY